MRAALDANAGKETTVVLDMEGIGSVDTTAVDHLADLADELEARGMVVGFARANREVLELFANAGLVARLGSDHCRLSR